MRIAFITPEFVRPEHVAGGVANYLLKTSSALVEEGHDVHVFAISKRSHAATLNGIHIHEVAGAKPSRKERLKRKTLWGNSYRSKVLNEALLKEHQRKRFDIVQYTSSRAVGLHRLREIPSVVRLSSYHRLWKSYVQRNAKARTKWINNWLELKSMKRSDAVYSPSQLISMYVQDRTGINVDVIEPIYIDDAAVDWEETEKLVPRNQRFALFAAGVLSPRKGADVVADMSYELLEEFPDLELVIAGPDAFHTGTSMIERIRSSAGRHGARVRYLGEVEHRILYGLIERSSVVLQPSRMDNLPNSCIEAMAHGAIVIATRGASFEQLITHGKNGFLATAGDAEDLIDKTKRALELNGKEADTMRTEARKRIESMRPPQSVRRLVDYYSRVINLKNRVK